MSVATEAVQIPGVWARRSWIRWGIAPSALLSVVFLGYLLLAVTVPSLIAPQDPFAVNANAAFSAPSLAHWFGTDHAGRDLYSRIVHGAGESVTIGVAATAVGVAGGLILGLASALFPNWVDNVLGRFIEVLFVFPTILMALALIVFLGSGVGPVIIAVGVGTIADNARLIRAQGLRIRDADYVVAARALGKSRNAILFQTILPNVIRPILVIATLGFGQAILWASSLSFLGFGAQPPAPEWGAILAEGRNYIQVAWWISAFPGIFITLSALSTTLLGYYVQRRLEGRS